QFRSCAAMQRNATFFQRNLGIEIAPLQSETVLFNPKNNKFCVLNKSAAFLWEKLDQPRTVGELASELCARFDVGEELALKDAQEAVQQFLAVEFVQTHSLA